MPLTAPQKMWLADLRSGNYQQGKYKLHSTTLDTYCCMGVACETAIANGVKLNVEDKIGFVEYDWTGGTLPISVTQWLDMKSTTGSFRYERDAVAAKKNNLAAYNLIKMNDDLDMTFEEIADFIEAHPEFFFNNDEDEADD